MRFLTLLALVLLSACGNAEDYCQTSEPISFPEIY
jgi:hypothetical protein